MQWDLIPPLPTSKINEIATSLNVSHTVASLLLQRGISTYDEAKAFFRPSLKELHDPFLMKDMDKAVDRILKAIDAEERILIYGDYDVDGTSSVALVARYLLSIYPKVATYIPDRYKEGYGVSYASIDFAEDNEFSLIIALDCGIKAIDKVAYANEKGIDFIICDHHRPGSELPKAVAVLDAKREDCNYPYDELCGCGVGFKLIQAIGSHYGHNITYLQQYLDIVATAIAADIVPLTGENRILAYFGMKQINSNPSIGIKALINQVSKDTLSITDVVFIIAPRINAAGRMKHGNYAVELLMEQDFDVALKMAAEIEMFNNERRDLDQKITKEALQQIAENKEENRATSVVYQEDWHKGVIGIVASRLIEKFYRPTLVFTKNGDKLAASARSVKGFDVYNALEACSDTIEQFGGHKYAAGLTLKPENYQKFKEAFEQVVKNTISEHCLSPTITISCELEFEEVTAKLFRIIKQFGPFGPQNMKPVFLLRQVVDGGGSRTIGVKNDHLRLDIKTKHGRKHLVGIGFNLGHLYDQIATKKPFDIVFTLEENHWNGISTLQLNVKDVRFG
ncbi:single-stranded-DNA-specific exonuclease RecJ [Flavobacteriaceae bacterium F08102]|nr:single-stranded-DNA-specific exonuclease RecJ [Flavobacteriaceae bacterium F08102]